MQTRGRRVNRWLAAVAAALIALGSTFVVVGTASASTPVGHFPVIKFWPNYNVVTMTVPLAGLVSEVEAVLRMATVRQRA